MRWIFAKPLMNFLCYLDEVSLANIASRLVMLNVSATVSEFRITIWWLSERAHSLIDIAAKLVMRFRFGLRIKQRAIFSAVLYYRLHVAPSLSRRRKTRRT